MVLSGPSLIIGAWRAATRRALPLIMSPLSIIEHDPRNGKSYLEKTRQKTNFIQRGRERSVALPFCRFGADGPKISPAPTPQREKRYRSPWDDQIVKSVAFHYIAVYNK